MSSPNRNAIVGSIAVVVCTTLTLLSVRPADAATARAAAPVVNASQHRA